MKSAIVVLMKKALLLVVGALFLVPPAIAQPQSGASSRDCMIRQGELPKTWKGQAFAIDGNTIAGIGLKPQIRLWGIQVAELRDRQTGRETAPGMQARAALTDLLEVADHRVSCRATTWDSDCRLVALCTIIAEMPTGSQPAPHDLALRLLEDGMAYGFQLEKAPPWDESASARYTHYETIARQAHKGLWPQWLEEK